MDVVDDRAIPIICGPTGSGKTGVAVELAERYPVEVVSADSRQIIKHLNIGTAKPGQDECNKVRFHLVGIIEPGERYTAFRFIDDATVAIEDILTRNGIPVVVGGTGLYLRALTDGVVEMELDDMSIRERLEKEMEDLGPEAMYEQLTRIDPLEAVTIHPNNRVRVIRALEIFYVTGKTKSELVATGVYRKSGYRYTYYGLLPSREALYTEINRRVDEMMANGLLDELQQLVKEGKAEDIHRARVIGYSELLEFLEENISLDEAVSLMKQNTRRYAKRQYTWFTRQANCRVFADKVSLRKAIDVDLELW